MTLSQLPEGHPSGPWQRWPCQGSCPPVPRGASTAGPGRRFLRHQGHSSDPPPIPVGAAQPGSWAGVGTGEEGPARGQRGHRGQLRRCGRAPGAGGELGGGRRLETRRHQTQLRSPDWAPPRTGGSEVTRIPSGVCPPRACQPAPPQTSRHMRGSQAGGSSCRDTGTPAHGRPRP